MNRCIGLDDERGFMGAIVDRNPKGGELGEERLKEGKHVVHGWREGGVGIEPCALDEGLRCSTTYPTARC